MLLHKVVPSCGFGASTKPPRFQAVIAGGQTVASPFGRFLAQSFTVAFAFRLVALFRGSESIRESLKTSFTSGLNHDNQGLVMTKRGTYTYSRIVLCQNCGKLFRGRPVKTEYGFSKYCSRACEVAKRPNPPVERTCGQCGKTFMKDHWSVNVVGNGGKFCSRVCIDMFKRKLRKRGEQEMFTNWQKREWKDDHCARCKETTFLELDHRVPRFAGGKATRENAQTLCRTCNRKKFWTDDYPLYLKLLKQRTLVG